MFAQWNNYIEATTENSKAIDRKTDLEVRRCKTEIGQLKKDKNETSAGGSVFYLKITHCGHRQH